jgi:hypothetical protein
VHSSKERVSEMGRRCEDRKVGEWCVRWVKERAARQRGQGGVLLGSGLGVLGEGVVVWLLLVLGVGFGEGVVMVVGLVGEGEEVEERVGMGWQERQWARKFWVILSRRGSGGGDLAVVVFSGGGGGSAGATFWRGRTGR